MSDFNKIIDKTLSYEGYNSKDIKKSYTNHPNDKGGPTTAGICLMFAKDTGDKALFDVNHDGKIDIDDIKNLTIDVVLKAYKKYFWDPFKLDSITNNKKCFMVFDAAVNHGVGASTKLTQRALNDIGFNLVIDGKYGKLTMGALEKADPLKFVNAFLIRRKALYQSIVDKTPSQKVFLKGWFNRIERIKKDLPNV